MGLIGSIKTFTEEVLTDTDLNTVLSTIRTGVNTYALFTDVDRTVTATLTFSTAPVFTNAQTFAAGVVVTTGGVEITAGGLTVTAGASSFGADVGVTGMVTATTFSGSGASLTNLPAAELTGTLPAVSGANLTDINGTNIATGTVAQARLPGSYTSLATSGTLSLTNGGAAGSVAAFSWSGTGYATTGASSPTALASAPTTGSGWAWVKVASNLGDGWLPFLLA